MSIEKVLNDIRVEREWQFAKGFSREHDDKHENGEIAAAAGLIAIDTQLIGSCLAVPGRSWMDDLALHVSEKYGDNKRKAMVIAATMLVAEIERIDRAAGHSN